MGMTTAVAKLRVVVGMISWLRNNNRKRSGIICHFLLMMLLTVVELM
jgi:hypothetical protein